MNPPPAALNFWVSSLVVVISLYLVHGLRRIREGEDRYTVWAFSCWVLAWTCWSALWAVEWLWQPATSEKHIVVLVLSDANTTFLLLASVGIIRGRLFRASDYVYYGLTVAATVALLIFGLYLIGKLDDSGMHLHAITSVAWGMFSPAAVGWGIRLRYNSKVPLVVGLIYGITQPPSYLALFSQGLPAPEFNPAMLVVLALLKVIWAGSVLLYLGLRPAKSHALELRGLPHPPLTELPINWKAALGLLAALGLIVVLYIGINMDVKMNQVVAVFTILGAVAGVIRLVLYLPKTLRWFRRLLGRTRQSRRGGGTGSKDKRGT